MGPHMGREGRTSSPSAEASPSTRPASGAGRGWLAGSWPLFSLEGSTGRGCVQPHQQARPTSQRPQPAWGLECPSGPRLEQVLGLSAQAEAPS